VTGAARDGSARGAWGRSGVGGGIGTAPVGAGTGGAGAGDTGGGGAENGGAGGDEASGVGMCPGAEAAADPA
jgi:hypothetical protein